MKNKALKEIQDICNDANLQNIDHQFPVFLDTICDALNIYANLTKDMPDNMSGKIFKVQRDDYQYQMDINFNNVPRRVRFTIAHEIGHYVKHKDYIDAHGSILERKDHGGYSPEQIKQEKEANQFASELLMPEYYFAQKYNELYQQMGYGNNVNEKVIKELSDIFWVSTQAVLYRIMMLGLDCA